VIALALCEVWVYVSYLGDSSSLEFAGSSLLYSFSFRVLLFLGEDVLSHCCF
jgi:hypothetical protein